MASTADVDRYMNDLRHPLKAGVVQLRAAILASNADITEHVKWNAPSFCYGGTDRVTFRLHPGDRLQLIFHRGATTRDDTCSFAFDDPSGLMKWLAPDRAVVDLPSLDAVADHEQEVVLLVNRWVVA